MARTDIADFLGLAPETISRLITSLADQQVVSIEGKTVRVMDLQGLTRICEQVD